MRRRANNEGKDMQKDAISVLQNRKWTNNEGKDMQEDAVSLLHNKSFLCLYQHSKS